MPNNDEKAILGSELLSANYYLLQDEAGGTKNCTKSNMRRIESYSLLLRCCYRLSQGMHQDYRIVDGTGARQVRRIHRCTLLSEMSAPRSPTVEV